MTMRVVNQAGALGIGVLAPGRVLIDLVAIANETSIGFDPEVNGMQRVTYARTGNAAPQVRLDGLVNTVFNPDYGNGPQQVDILLIAAPDNFVFDDGTVVAVDNGVTLPPSNSGLVSAEDNPTVNCIILYDTEIEICLVGSGSGATDLRVPSPVALYHEMSHAFRIVNNGLLEVTAVCSPASAEEHAAILDENDMRRQWAAMMGEPEILRDPDSHCAGDCPGGGGGGCCIVASLVSGSPRSPHVQQLRAVRDRFVRRTEVGFQFFDRLFYDYYAFSPQVCAMLAANPELAGATLRGYVEPLMDFWTFMVERHQAPQRDAEALGALFRQRMRSCDDLDARRSSIALARGFWERLDVGDGRFPELRALLRTHAWNSAYVRWALVRPVGIYAAALDMFNAGVTAVELGSHLSAELDAWTFEFPIEPFWGSLSSDEVRSELATCDTLLFQSRSARLRFRERLLEAFSGVTSLLRVCTEPIEETVS